MGDWLLAVTAPRRRAQPLLSLPKPGHLRFDPQSRWRFGGAGAALTGGEGAPKMRRMSSRPQLSIVIPAYNEERRLGPTLERVGAWLDEQGRDAEILVVDDGSADGTSDLVRARAQEDPRVRLLGERVNRGKGYSVGEGVAAARGERILFSDADLSTPIEELPKLEAALEREGAQVAIGSRAKPGASLERRQPFYREGMGRAFNLLVQVLVFPGIRDTQCGFKLFTAEAARTLFAHRRIDGFAFDVELLYVARRLGYRIAEVPVRWVNDEASRVDPVRDSLRMFRDILRVRALHRDL